MQANNTMEREMLEEQLGRARKDNVALKRRLECLASGGPQHPALLRAAQVRAAA